MLKILKALFSCKFMNIFSSCWKFPSNHLNSQKFTFKRSKQRDDWLCEYIHSVNMKNPIHDFNWHFPRGSTCAELLSVKETTFCFSKISSFCLAEPLETSFFTLIKFMLKKYANHFKLFSFQFQTKMSKFTYISW